VVDNSQSVRCDILAAMGATAALGRRSLPGHETATGGSVVFRMAEPMAKAAMAGKKGVKDETYIGPRKRDKDEKCLAVGHIHATRNGMMVHAMDLPGADTLCKVSGGQGGCPPRELPCAGMKIGKIEDVTPLPHDSTLRGRRLYAIDLAHFANPVGELKNARSEVMCVSANVGADPTARLQHVSCS
jgi:ribosomal protein S11